MNTIIKFFFAGIVIAGTSYAATAQQSSVPVGQKPGKYEVTTHLVEQRGTLEERRLYREFLKEYMKNCPYISDFNVQQSVGSGNNHDVVWTYDVNSWNDITRFYSWISSQLKSSDDDGLKKAMTPYAPDYAIGGQIQLEKRSKTTLAKD